MKIALYYPWVHLKSGVERTILETLKRSEHEYKIFTNHLDLKTTFPEFKKLKIKELKKIPVRRNILSVVKAAFIIAFQKINLSGFDLLMVHSEGLGDLILLRNNQIPTVCYCHTPLRPVFDIEYKNRARSKRSFIRKIIYVFMDSVYKILDRYLWKKYKYIFFNSNETLKRAISGRLINHSSKFSILHPGIDYNADKPTWVFNNYFFVPGRITWTKNIELAIESFLIFENSFRKNNKFKLIIGGLVDHKSDKYLKSLKTMAKKSDNIKFILNPSDARMKALYNNCYAVITTSFNEDWGITAIEANSHGKAVLAVKKGGFTESQINGKTGYLVPNNPKKFAEKMLYLANNKSVTKAYGKSARINAKSYDWSFFAKTFDLKINEII